MTPLLVMMFGITPSTAVGTDLLYAALTKASGVWAHHKKHNVDWKVTRQLMAGSIPASLITLAVLGHVKTTSHFETYVRLGLAFALILTAVALLCGAGKKRCILKLAQSPGTTARWTLLLGALIGLLVTLSSVGAGAVGTAALVALYPEMAVVRIVGTDIAHAVPLTLLAGLGHFTLGHVNISLLANLLVGSIPGIWIGSHLTARMPEQLLRVLLAILLLLIAGKMLL